MSSYDIGIVGYWYATNYGSAMTYYALSRAMNQMGFSTVLIESPMKDQDPEGENVFSRIFLRAHCNISESIPWDKQRALNDLCDGFMVGSDQVWTSFAIRHMRDMFFLGFVDEEKKKVAYAPSFGNADFFQPTPEQEQMVKRCLNRFDRISVREDSGREIVRNRFGIRADQTLDPVFLISQDEYRKISAESQRDVEGKYILAYILDPTPDKEEFIRKTAQKLSIDVKIVLDGRAGTFPKNRAKFQHYSDDVIQKDVDLPDWTKLFQNAAYVVTDSHHGVAMAVIYNKNFLCYPNYSRGYSRFVSLMSLLGLMDRMVPNTNSLTENILLQDVNYARVNEILQKQRERSLQWLRDAFSLPKSKLPSIRLPENTVALKVDKHLCTGCGACVSSCPTDALELIPDENGYYRSSVDYDRCVNCGKCINVCPALKLPDKTNRKEPKCYEFVAADSQVLKNSSSGGIFPLLAQEAFRRKGSVVGAAWQEDFSVAHIMIDSEQDLPKLQKSKYLQSYLGNTFRQVEKKLKDGEFVLFSGCPCQVTGLKSYLGKEYDNLLTVDLLCGNSPSTRFFQEYLKEQFPEGLQAYEFRNKTEGWNWDGVLITLKNGEQQYRRGGKDDDYQRVYHNHTMCAPHCENCRYQETPRFGDLTIGDFWGIGGKDKTLNTRNGVSVILCNNEKGEKYLSAIPEEQIGVMKEVPLAWLGGNGYAINKSHNYCSPKRNQFYELVKAMPFSKAVDYALKPMHGEVVSRYQHTNALLQFDMAMQRFKFNPDIWEEHTINGATVLFAKQQQTKPGNYAMMPLCRALEKGRKYRLDIKFRVNSTSEVVNLHIKDSGSSYNQVIYSHRNANQNKGQWVQLSVDFVPNSKIYDEFMIGASQISGPDAYIAFEHIVISEV